MSIPFAGVAENPLDFRIFKKNPKNQNLKKLGQTYPNLKSLWAFLSFTFVYISAFYVFKLSPSTLLCTTKFWFFISNILVLIIAADFSAFAGRDSHEEHVIKSDTTLKSTEFPSSDVVSLEMTTKTSYDVEEEEEEEEEEEAQEKIIYTSREKKPQKCARSNSESAVVLASATAAAEEEGKVVALQRTLSDGHDREELNNEFSRMSDEELNTRVEEFIRRFHRQIRLQSAGNQWGQKM